MSPQAMPEADTCRRASRKTATCAGGLQSITVELRTQAMLEADPTSREPQDSYLARYQTFARDELNLALSMYDALQGALGGLGSL